MKKNHLVILLLFVCILFSCEEEKVYGDTLIYMPQATRNIGTDNNLNIDLISSSSADTSVVLGVYRSGLQELLDYSVDLMVNTDTVAKAQAIAQQPGSSEAYAIYKTGILLPANYYTPLPPTLTVASGNREATTMLVLKKSLILNDFASGSILLLPVQIDNPTRYKLNQSLSLTMIVMRVE